MAGDPYAGAPASDTTEPWDFSCQGIDVSSNQGRYDWDAALGAGIRFAFARLSLGKGTEDDQFATNWAAMAERKEQIVRGAYHFAYPSTVAAGKTPSEDAADEANYFCDRLLVYEQKVHGGTPMADGATLPPVLDYEQTPDNSKLTLSSVQQKDWINTWIQTVQDRLGRGVLLYSGPNVWRKDFDGDPWLRELPLWVAQYTSPSSRKIDPWSNWCFWQWSGGGNGDMYQKHYGSNFPGSGGHAVDVSAFWGSVDQLRSLCDPSQDRFLGADGSIGPKSGVESSSPVSTSTSTSLSLAPPPPPSVDISTLAGRYSPIVARVQGLLLSQGYGPSGLVGRDGAPDGLYGSKTASALSGFKASVGLSSDTLVDWPTWWALVTKGLD